MPKPQAGPPSLTAEKIPKPKARPTSLIWPAGVRIKPSSAPADECVATGDAEEELQEQPVPEPSPPKARPLR